MADPSPTKAVPAKRTGEVRHALLHQIRLRHTAGRSYAERFFLLFTGSTATPSAHHTVWWSVRLQRLPHHPATGRPKPADGGWTHIRRGRVPYPRQVAWSGDTSRGSLAAFSAQPRVQRERFTSARSISCFALPSRTAFIMNIPKWYA